MFSPGDDGVVGVRCLMGRDTIEDTLLDVRYQMGPGDFFQTNPAVAEQMLKRGLELLDLGPEDAVVDLYSGVGGWALQAAAKGAFAIGVETVDGAVTRARESARRNKLAAEFVSGDVLEILPEVQRRLAAVRPTVVINPSRRGLEEGVVEAVMALRPRQVAYVSCNPMSMARDLLAFQEAGMRIGEVELFDMFPNTAHVECLVRLVGPEFHAPRGRVPRRRRTSRG
jgi:23S rRNA (uracil1939-C5)-methyltransferase